MQGSTNAKDDDNFIIRLDGSMNRISDVNLRVDQEAQAVVLSTHITITQNAKKTALFKPESVDL